jgi:hypothetical protein
MTGPPDHLNEGPPADVFPEEIKQSNYVLNELKSILLGTQDNFGRQVANPLVDLIDVAGEKDFTPERLRYFKDGQRIFIQYGSDPTFSNTERGFLLQPGSDQTLTLRTGEKAAYQVGFDLWPTMSRQINGTLEPGDVVGGGYGRLDLQDFDPTAVDPGGDNPASGVYAGADADGYFWYHTTDTGTGDVLLAMVQSGTVLDSRIVSLVKGISTFTIMEQQLNWYAVGPCVYRESSTDVSQFPSRPQVNQIVGAVANDDGPGPAEGSHRLTTSIKQGAGNTGLELEVGSKGIRTPGTAIPQFKVKGHSMDLDLTETGDGTYQVLAAIRIDPEREEVKLRFTDLTIISTPGNSVSRARVIIQSVAPENTNADDFTFTTPVEHSEANSVLREVEVAGDAGTPLTGPIEDDPATDASGAATANTMTNPGGYQLLRASLTPEGGGQSSSVTTTTQEGNRELYPGDIGLVLVDGADSGEYEIDISTEQNS